MKIVKSIFSDSFAQHEGVVSEQCRVAAILQDYAEQLRSLSTASWMKVLVHLNIEERIWIKADMTSYTGTVKNSPNQQPTTITLWHRRQVNYSIISWWLDPLFYT